MHELAITQCVVEAVVERVGPDRVTMVRLEIGALSGVEVDAVRFCFDVVARGTSVEGARLEIDEPAGEGHCRRCAARFPVTDPLAVCDCGSVDVRISSGDQLRVREVEVARDVRDVRL